MMQIPICLVLIVVYACNATINITGEDKLLFENTEKLSITCTNNVDAIVEFKKSDSLLTTCVYSSCAFIDQRFTVVFESSKKQYLLESVSNFTTDLCGSYQCVDVTNGRSDTVNVSFKDFDITSSHAEENEDELSISTACVFPATPDDIEITWYTLDNKTLQRISDEDLDEFKRFNRSTLCSNVTCGMHHARSYTFGLNFTGMRGYFFLSYVEIKVVHAMFKDKPLVWRSSKKYHVLAQSAPYHPDRDSSNTYWWVGMISGVVILAFAIFTTCLVGVKLKVNRNIDKDELCMTQFIKSSQ